MSVKLLMILFCCFYSTWPINAMDLLQADDLIGVLRTASKANLDRYPEGKVVAHYSNSVVKNGTKLKEQFLKIECVWSGDLKRVEEKRYKSVEDLKSSDGKPTQVLTWIQDKTKTQMLSHNQKALYISANNRRLEEGLFQKPAERWFGMVKERSLTWVAILGPNDQEFLRKRPDAKYTVQKISDDLIRVEQTDSRHGELLTVDFSLSLDGNVNRYEYKQGTTYTESGRYNWGRDSSNRLYLKSCEADIISKDTTTNIRYEVVQTDLGYKADNKIFQTDKIGLVKGMMIYDEIKSRDYRWPDNRPPKIEEQLPALIDSMKAKGLAAPKREK